jgi:hypothetical protein
MPRRQDDLRLRLEIEPEDHLGNHSSNDLIGEPLEIRRWAFKPGHSTVLEFSPDRSDIDQWWLVVLKDFNGVLSTLIIKSAKKDLSCAKETSWGKGGKV